MALSNSQYDAIMRTYEKRRLAARGILDQRQREVYRAIPGFQDLDQAIAHLAVSRAKKSLLEGSAPQAQTESGELAALIEKKKALLTGSGYPENYLEDAFTCPLCQDTGYIGGQKCRCFKKAVVDLLYAQSHLAQILKEENFDRFRFDYYSPGNIDPKSGRSSLDIMKDVHRICLDFVRDFDDTFQNLFFYGDTGVGKSFLSNCIAKELIESAHSVVYFSAFELFDELAGLRFQRTEEADPLTESVCDCDLLIIDDLGTELVNSFVISQLFLCINERILRRRSTIISTNLTLRAITDTYSERIFSRITSNYTMLKLTGDDIRIKRRLRNMED